MYKSKLSRVTDEFFFHKTSSCLVLLKNLNNPGFSQPLPLQFTFIQWCWLIIYYDLFSSPLQKFTKLHAYLQYGTGSGFQGHK